MQVTFRQSGGASGFVRGVDLDTARLDPKTAGRLEHLVKTSGIEGETERVSESARDLRQYEVVIRVGGHVASLLCDDATLPKQARPLIRFLDAHAGPL
jgi:emfourin